MMKIEFSNEEVFNKRNKKAFSKLLHFVQSGVNITPFIGAGFSAGICPTWRNLLLKVANDYGKAIGKRNIYSNQVQVLLDNGKYEDAASYLFDKMGENEFVQAIRDQIEVDAFHWEDITKACKQLPKLFIGGAVTTNLDNVLEHVYKKNKKEYSDVIIPRSESDGKFVDRICKLNMHCLLKLHGNISYPETWILTKEEYDKHYSGTSYEECMRELFMSANFLFLGCSLNQDRTLKVLTELSTDKKLNREFYHFAILEMPQITEGVSSSDEFEHRVKNLSDAGITVIWYQHGDHEAVTEILDELIKARSNAGVRFFKRRTDWADGKGGSDPKAISKFVRRIAVVVASVALVAIASIGLSSLFHKKDTPEQTPTPVITYNTPSASQLSTLTPSAAVSSFLEPMSNAKVGSVVSGRIAAGSDYTAILLDDGSVQVFGGEISEIDTSGWGKVIQISGYDNHLVGLRADGMLEVTGQNNDGQISVQNWKNVLQVATGYHSTVGLDKDGNILYAGPYNHNMGKCKEWEDIVTLVAGDDHLAGIKADRTMEASGYNEVHQCDLNSYKNVRCAAVGCQYTFIVDDQGMVSIAGGNPKYAYGQIKASSWSNIIAIDSGDRHVIGLDMFGKVHAEGEYSDQKLNVGQWENVIAICAGQFHSVAICSDGVVHATGEYKYGQCDCDGIDLW